MPAANPMVKLIDSRASGNAWKVRLLLRYLGIPYERETLDLTKGNHKTPRFEQKNPFRRIPVLELSDGFCLYESNAILMHLAKTTDLLPEDPRKNSEVMAWLFYEQADLMRFLAYPRFYKITNQAEKFASVIDHYLSLVDANLGAVETKLVNGGWLAGDNLSIADFAMYPYIHLSPEGGYELEKWPSIVSWLGRFEKLPGYQPLFAD